MTRLSLRQDQVARLIARGYSNKEIARELELGEGTVKVHIAHTFRKFGVNKRAALAAKVAGASNLEG
jgi:DNA-binding NarL/FixJ family response regulator